MSFSIKTNNEAGTIILLHGYGSDADDLLFLAKEWKQYFKDWNFVGIDGHMQLPSGGYAWFDMLSDDIFQDLRKAYYILSEKLKDYKKPIILGGFSQGAFLASSLALYSDLNIIGAISFCGGIIPLGLPIKNREIYLINGKDDEMITEYWFNEALKFGEKYNLNIKGIMIENMQHDINSIALAHATLRISKMIDHNITIQ